MPTQLGMSLISINLSGNIGSIQYHVLKSCHVGLEIYSQSGKFVRALVNGEKASGEYSVKWNSIDMAGKKLSNGVYYYRLKTGDKATFGKMINVR